MLRRRWERHWPSLGPAKRVVFPRYLHDRPRRKDPLSTDITELILLQLRSLQEVAGNRGEGRGGEESPGEIAPEAMRMPEAGVSMVVIKW
jgi:hypothetical protein